MLLFRFCRWRFVIVSYCNSISPLRWTWAYGSREISGTKCNFNVGTSDLWKQTSDCCQNVIALYPSKPHAAFLTSNFTIPTQ